MDQKDWPDQGFEESKDTDPESISVLDVENSCSNESKEVGTSTPCFAFVHMFLC